MLVSARQNEFYQNIHLVSETRIYERCSVKFSAVNESGENNPKPIISFSRYEDMKDYI